MPLRNFAYVQHPDAQPGRCVRCPRNQNLYDLGAPDIAGFGVVYVCAVCMGELLKQMGVISAEQHQAAVGEVTNRVDQLERELAVAEKQANLPLTFITTTLEEFSNGIAVLADRAVRDLAAGPAGGDPVPLPRADKVAPREPELPLEGAGEPAHVDPPTVGVDDGAALLAALLGADGVPGAPAGADAGSDGGDDHFDGTGDGLALLYDETTD